MAGLMQDLIQNDVTYLLNEFQEKEKSINDKINALLYNFDSFVKTNDVSYLIKECKRDGQENRGILNESVKMKKIGRSKRGVLAEITEPVTGRGVKIKSEKGSNLQLLTSIDENSPAFTVKSKQEMLPPKQLRRTKKNIKIETVDVPKRSARTRKKIERYGYSSKVSTSDIVILNPSIVTVDLCNDGNTEVEESVELNNEKSFSTRLTRTRKIQSQLVLPILDSEHTEVIEETELAETEGNASSQTEYEDALSSLEGQLSSNIKSNIFVTNENEIENTSPPVLINSTITVNPRMSPKSVKVDNQAKIPNIRAKCEDPLSSLETWLSSNIKSDTFITNSEHKIENISPAALINSTITVNPRMSPKSVKVDKQAKIPNIRAKCEDPLSSLDTWLSSNIKSDTFITNNEHKIENISPAALINSTITDYPEMIPKAVKIQEDNIAKTPHLYKKTSTTTGAKGSIKTSALLKSKISQNVTQVQSHERELKSKYHTPLLCRLTPKVNNPMSSNKNSLSSKQSQSALKCSQEEFREREKRRQEKGQDALKKRDALLQSIAKEKKRKREEKQLKAQQQQKELLEKEMQRFMEAQKLKEEKFKQAMAEKEEKLQKLKEESERKQYLAKKRAEEMKRKEQILLSQNNRLPIYMTTPTPLLPTNDCYDTDEESYQHTQRQKPKWSESHYLNKMQLIMLSIGETIKNSFFCRKVQTVILDEIFETIDSRKLKRTSSAIWKKPPRYTLFQESFNVFQDSETDENF